MTGYELQVRARLKALGEEGNDVARVAATSGDQAFRDLIARHACAGDSIDVCIADLLGKS